MNPTVSFVVPCYRLAHFLPECLDSILRQNYREIEILILDDCSPDNTAEVAARYTDSCVKYVRNDPNLGHLRNYNKGITLAEGKYVWLISADDCLRRPYIVERYVEMLEKNPNVGFVFCPAVGLGEQGETELLRYSMRGEHNAIFPGRQFLIDQLLGSDCIVVASALARKDCYTKVGFYPLDMPYAGDWYIWSLFALYYDVGYFCEPMVNYREHGLSMTNNLKQKNAAILIQDEFAVLWRIREKANGLRLSSVVERCDSNLVDRYVLCMTREVHDLGSFRLSEEQCVASVMENAPNRCLESKLLSRIYALLADECYWQGDRARSLGLYQRSLGIEPNNMNVRIKSFLLKTGSLGVWARSGLLSLRRALANRANRPRGLD